MLKAQSIKRLAEQTLSLADGEEDFRDAKVGPIRGWPSNLCPSEEEEEDYTTVQTIQIE